MGSSAVPIQSPTTTPPCPRRGCVVIASPSKESGTQRDLEHALLRSERPAQLSRHVGPIENRSSKLSRPSPQHVNFPGRVMSLSLGGASSPLSYRENILRAPPGSCHQLRAAIACQGLFSPEPDALSELCGNLFLLIKRLNCYVQQYVSGAILCLGTQSPGSLSRCPESHIDIYHHTQLQSLLSTLLRVSDLAP